jgi:hypothetical protein
MSSRFVRLLAAPIAALALAAGAAAAPAASASVTPDCVWQPLTLQDGWQSAQGDWNTGDPAYCVDNGIVYLSGSLKNPANPGVEFFGWLPPQALPTSGVDLLTYTYNGSTGQLIIESNGAMYAGGSGAAQYTSLAGLSFPAAGTAVSPLTLYPGWQSGQSPYATGDPGYVVTNGIAHWTGSVTNTTADSAYIIGPVPGAYPDGCLEANVYTYDGHVGSLDIWPPAAGVPLGSGDHDLFVRDTTVGTTYYRSLTVLDGISYPVSGTATWQPLTLQSGWAPVPPNDYCKNYQSTPSYYVRGHIAYLTGEISGGGFIGTLPAAARPQHDLYLFAGPNEYLHISPNGNMWGFGANNTIWLGNISYQTSS